jgi:uncharacterized Zn finger protein
MSKCPHCKGEVKLETIKKQTKGFGFLKQEIMYSCPHCGCILGFSRGKFMS